MGVGAGRAPARPGLRYNPAGERTSELAVLKTLGFSDAKILTLVLAESLFIAVAGGGLGLLVA